MTDAYKLTETAVRQLAADHIRLRQQFYNLRQQLPTDGGDDLPDPPVLFRNTSSETAPPFALLAVVDATGPVADPIFNIDKPTSTFHRVYLVNGPDPCTQNAVGVAQKGPDVKFAFDTGSPSTGDGFGPKAGTWLPTKNYPSCLSVAGIVDSDNKIAYGRLDPINVVIGKLAGSLSVGDHATVNVYAGAGGSEAVVSSLTIDGRDWLMTSGQTALPSGTKVLCTWANGIWYIVGLESNDGAIGIGKTAGAIAKGSSGTVNTYSDSSTATGNSITAYNLFGDVGSGKWVAYAKIGSTYYLIAAEC